MDKKKKSLNNIKTSAPSKPAISIKSDTKKINKAASAVEKTKISTTATNSKVRNKSEGGEFDFL